MYYDKISVSLKENPEFAAAVAGASPGDTITIKELEVIIDEIANDLVVGSICCDVGDVTVTPGPDNDGEDMSDDEKKNADDIVSVMAPGYKNAK